MSIKNEYLLFIAENCLKQFYKVKLGVKNLNIGYKLFSVEIRKKSNNIIKRNVYYGLGFVELIFIFNQN